MVRVNQSTPARNDERAAVLSMTISGHALSPASRFAFSEAALHHLLGKGASDWEGDRRGNDPRTIATALLRRKA